MAETRKLAAILAADVAGYSRLAGADEERTLARLRALRSDLMDPTVALHHGRVVKRTGDGSIVEFRSVVDAVRCAIEVQNGMIERNAGLPPERRIEFRVGIHLGDVVEESDGDLMGDGVNIATRLEGIAKPGSICLSEDAYRQVRDRIKEGFADLGEKELKNIARPVRVHALKTGSELSAPQTSAPEKVGPPRLSIVVLPFANLSGDPTQDYLADVLTDALTTGLSRLPESFVIARSTAFTWKNKPIDVRQIGKDLGVRYALEGSVLPSGDRLRVNAQLIDAEKNAHLWADQFDEKRADLLQMQDDIVTRLARAVGYRMTVAEAGRAARAGAASSTAQDLSLRCYATMLRADFGEKELDAGYRLCEEALQIEPENVLALSTLSFKFSHRVFEFRSSDRETGSRRADELASAALKVNRDFFLAYFAKGDALLAQGRYREAIDAFHHGLSLNPGQVAAYGGLATAHNYLGEPELTLAEVERAMRLSPHDPWAANFYFNNAVAYTILEDYQQALVWLRRNYAAGPFDNPWKGFFEASLLALAGHEAEARATMQRYLATGKAPVQTIVRWRQVRLPSDAPRFLALRQKFEEGLRKAGMPEE
jgi:adenylate cyclase